MTIDETNIALKSDMQHKYGMKDWELNYTWLDVRDEHVMVWFQMESLPTFTKLWGHMTQTLRHGENYTLVVENNWLNVTEFNGMKSVYLSEVNSFGGKNASLGIFFLVLAAIEGAMMIVFIVLYIHKYRDQNIYSTENLSWD